LSMASIPDGSSHARDWSSGNTGKVAEIYQEIKESLGIEFVPNMYKAMAPNPDFLETKWNNIKTVMQRPGKLDKLTREIIAVAVSSMNGCEY
jgi:alkylhydroperoxidase/carboxymuconolactone decarboxylase family protein YurZ